MDTDFAARTTRDMLKKVASCILTSSHSDVERKLTDTPSGSAPGPEGVSCFEEASGSEGASRLHNAFVPASPVHSALSDEADSNDSTLAPQIDVLAPVVDQPNRW